MQERIPRKKQQHIGISSEQTLLCPHHDWLLPPRTQRRKPQIPIEPRLIRRVNPRRLAWVLWLETEGIHEPGLSVVGTLGRDFIDPARHNGQQPIAVLVTKRIQRRKRWKRE